MVPDPYKILGLQHEASGDEIKRSYRKLAMKLHPDRLIRTGASEVVIMMATSQFATVTAAYSLLSDPIRKRQYDHIFKFGGYDDTSKKPAQSSRDTSENRPPSARSRKAQKGIGYAFMDPLTYVLSNGKVKSHAVAGISIPSRLNIGQRPENCFRISLSSGRAKESDTGSLHCRSTTMQFSGGKKINKVETTKIHRDGRMEVVIEGDDYIERRFRAAPKRKRRTQSGTSRLEGVEESRDDRDGLTYGKDDIPWHAQILRDITSSLQKCTNPNLCEAITVR